jgi:uncharacterized OsmC-like protein/alpha-beta hydrolase superfamily lysophospholipase
MARRSERFDFEGSHGGQLSGRLERPAGEIRAVALFAHCFTCGKDIAAASRIARDLAERGIAVLRFDFTGLGHSEGEFANSDFASNVEDLVWAADALRERVGAPQLLVGHSLGGTAVLAAAARIPESTAVATIGAPASPEHVRGLLAGDAERIEREGSAEVEIAGRRFRIGRPLLEDLGAHDLERRIGEMRRALLVLHAPLDNIVSIDEATRIFLAARHPKSFVSLDRADHLLSRREDARYAAEVIAAWADRFLPPAPEPEVPEADQGEVIVFESGDGPYAQTIAAGPHVLHADEPASVGGRDTGPTPYGLLLASLGACTAMTLRMYARRKGIALEHVSVRLRHEKVHATDCETCETQTGHLDRIDRTIELAGDLDAATRARLLEIAERCPVHRTLHSEVWVRSELAAATRRSP